MLDDNHQHRKQIAYTTMLLIYSHWVDRSPFMSFMSYLERETRRDGISYESTSDNPRPVYVFNGEFFRHKEWEMI